MQPIKTILLVDATDHSRIALRWFLATFGYVVDSVRDAEEAIQIFDRTIHDLVVTDYQMNGMTGVELAQVIKMRSPATPVILYAHVQPDGADLFDAIVPRPNETRPKHDLLFVKNAIDDVFLARKERISRSSAS